MKKLFILLSLLLSLSSVHADAMPLLVSEPMPVLYSDNAVSVQDDAPMMCTMDYVPVCGINSTTYGNACGAGKNKIAYKGECDSYIDNALYAKLESTKIEVLKRQLSRYSDAKLTSVLATIDQRITMVKLSRIAREMQVERITLYTFVKNTIPTVLASHAPVQTGKRPGIENIAYTIDGQTVTLKGGISETTTTTGSSAKTITRYFGNTTLGDLNGDGTDDVVFVLTQETGGSGLFYYAAAALMMQDGYHGTNAVFLGDRIAPQSTEIKNGQITVNYADRKTNEAMTVTPSVAASKYLKVSGTTLTEITK